MASTPGKVRRQKLYSEVFNEEDVYKDIVVEIEETMCKEPNSSDEE